jgi:drug/metabolite transporter (DMT)-like permease
MERRAALLFVALAFAWGIPYLLIKVSVAELDPAVLVLLRTWVAALVLVPIALARGAIGPVLRHWKVLVVYAVIEIAIPWVLLGHAEQTLPSATTGLLIAATPMVGVMLAFALGRSEHLGGKGWIGLLLGLVGVAALVGLDVRGSDRLAVLQLLVVVIGYAAGPVLIVRYLKDESGLAVIAVAVTIAAVMYVPVVLLGPGLPTAMPSGQVIASVLILGLVCTAAAFVMLFSLVGMIGPVRATAITYVNPAVAIVVGVLFLDERVTTWTLVGFGLVLAGSWLLTRSPSVPEGDSPEVDDEPLYVPADLGDAEPRLLRTAA